MSIAPFARQLMLAGSLTVGGAGLVAASVLTPEPELTAIATPHDLTNPGAQESYLRASRWATGIPGSLALFGGSALTVLALRNRRRSVTDQKIDDYLVGVNDSILQFMRVHSQGQISLRAILNGMDRQDLQGNSSSAPVVSLSFKVTVNDDIGNVSVSDARKMAEKEGVFFIKHNGKWTVRLPKY